jgi:hypothetical protein
MFMFIFKKGTNHDNDHIKKELEQLRADNNTLSKELDYYIRVCKDKDNTAISRNPKNEVGSCIIL